MTVGSLAFDFILEHGNTIFQDIPIVFASVNASRIAQAPLKENVTGVAVERDVRQTVDLLLAIQPDVQQIVIPIGSSPTEKEWAEDTRQLFKPYKKRVRVEYLSDLSMEAMLRRLSALPAHSAVLFTTVFYYDAGGQYSCPTRRWPASRLDRLRRYSVPTKLFWDQEWSAASSTTLRRPPTQPPEFERVLAGDKPASIPVETVNPNRPMFDARQLERWKIPKSRLPAGSVIRFEEIGTWARYKVYIVGAASLVVFQAALIVGLIVMSARRQRAETSLRVSHVQIRDLAGRLITVQEQERSRIARELHDDVCQRMALIGMELTRLKVLPDGAVDSRTQVANSTMRSLSLPGTSRVFLPSCIPPSWSISASLSQPATFARKHRITTG